MLLIRNYSVFFYFFCPFLRNQAACFYKISFLVGGNIISESFYSSESSK